MAGRNRHDEDLRLRCPGCAKRFCTREGVANHVRSTLHGELLIDHSMPDPDVTHLSPLERAKASYQPMQSVDRLVGLEREPHTQKGNP